MSAMDVDVVTGEVRGPVFVDSCPVEYRRARIALRGVVAGVALAMLVGVTLAGWGLLRLALAVAVVVEHPLFAIASVVGGVVLWRRRKR